MKKLSILAFLLVLPIGASAQSLSHYQNWCQLGGQKVNLQGLQSTNEVQRSIPSCHVEIFNAGTTNDASIFSDNLSTPTPKANPFAALSNGTVDFWAAPACYDIVTSGGVGSDVFPAPYTYSSVCLGSSGGGGGGSGSVTSVGLSAPAGFQVSGSPVTGIGTLSLSMPSGWTSQDLLLGSGANSVSRLPLGGNNTCLTIISGAVSWGAAPCVGIPSGTTNQVIKYLNGPSSIVGNSSLFDDSINPVQSPNGLSVMTAGATRILTNATPATTVLNQLVERNASGFAINASSSSTRALGIAGQGAGVDGGGVQVTFAGFGPCVFDNQTVINDYVTPSSTGGLCHDAGVTRPLNAEVIGTVTTTNSGAATLATVDFFTGDTSQTTPSAVNPCGSSPGPLAYYTLASVLGCDQTLQTDGSGNLSGISSTFSGSSAGFLFFTASSQPTFGVANSAYLFAPTTIPTTYALKLPSALGTSGQALTISGVTSNVATLAWSSAAGCPEGTCIQNAPLADQVITGGHDLEIAGGGNLVLSNTGATPSTAETLIEIDSGGAGAFAYSDGAGASSGIRLLPTTSAIYLGQVAGGADDGAHGVIVHDSGLSLLGKYSDNVVLAIGTSGLEGIFTTQPPSGGGSYTFRSGATASNNVITFPNSTGTLANIVSGVLTTPNLTLSSITGSTQCLHVNTSGVVSGTAGDCATGGSGTVTSIATTAPLGGGTITTTGTLTCTTCVVASSPGLGLAHFAGSTQTVTSSLIVNADITASTIDLTTKVTGILPSANGGTANGFFTVSGPATSAKTFTFPNASATVLTSNTAVTVAQGGTGLTSGTSGGILGFTGSTTLASSGVLTTNALIKGGGAGATPSPSLFTDSGTVGAYTGTGGFTSPTYQTATNCAASGTAANPSVVSCSAAAAGIIYCDVAASAGTCTVNTSAVTTSSEIRITPSTADGTLLSKTCNASPSAFPAILLSAKVNGTSFTLNMPTGVTNGFCFEYSIVN